MKKCSKCKVLKDTIHFGILSHKKDGLRGICKPCRKDNYRTKKGKVSQIYNNQVKNSGIRLHDEPTYTKKELYEWCMSQKIFHTLYDNWKRLDFQTSYAPSIDRKNHKLGYNISNIQLMTWKENNDKSRGEQDGL